MPSIGSVVSTAITGGDAPVFHSTKEVKQLAKAVAKETDSNTEALEKQVSDLSNLVKQLLEAQTKPTEDTPDETEESTEELTAGQKAAKTRAENKAKAEAEAE